MKKISMKKTSSKKGFSLIELIVVIAVIAAIAAVIVPSITNFNKQAKRTADQRNVQLWNQTYLEAKAAGALTAIPTGNTATVAPAIAVTTTDTPIISFNAASFTTKAGTMAWDNNTGITFTNNM